MCPSSLESYHVLGCMRDARVAVGLHPNGFSPCSLSDENKTSHVLMRAFPGDRLRKSSSFSFAKHASGQQAKKALCILVRLQIEGKKSILNARRGLDANDSGDEKKEWNKGGEKEDKKKSTGNSGKNSSVGGESGEELEMGGDCDVDDETVKNAEASIRLIYMGLISADNPEIVTKHV